MRREQKVYYRAGEETQKLYLEDAGGGEDLQLDYMLTWPEWPVSTQRMLARVGRGAGMKQWQEEESFGKSPNDPLKMRAGEKGVA